MITKGPSEEWIAHATALRDVRLHWVVWFPSDVKDELEELEGAIREVGLNREWLKDTEVGELRSQLVRAIYATFTRLHTGDEDEPSITESVFLIAKLLGVDELTAIREAVFNRAVKTLRDAEVG